MCSHHQRGRCTPYRMDDRCYKRCPDYTVHLGTAVNTFLHRGPLGEHRLCSSEHFSLHTSSMWHDILCICCQCRGTAGAYTQKHTLHEGFHFLSDGSIAPLLVSGTGCSQSASDPHRSGRSGGRLYRPHAEGRIPPHSWVCTGLGGAQESRDRDCTEWLRGLHKQHRSCGRLCTCQQCLCRSHQGNGRHTSLDAALFQKGSSDTSGCLGYTSGKTGHMRSSFHC